MACQNCKGERIMSVSAKCGDCCSVEYNGMEKHDYVPDHIGLGGGDYIELDFCLDCGQIQGEFPLEEIDEL